MSDAINIDPGTLRTAAGQADEVASLVTAAKQASGAALSDNAFGLICSPLMLPPYLLVQAAADLMMASASKAVSTSAQNLIDAAARFELTDEGSASNISALGG